MCTQLCSTLETGCDAAAQECSADTSATACRRAEECFKRAIELEANDASYLQLGQLYAQQVRQLTRCH